jgi:two-component sensor histidine kinase
MSMDSQLRSELIKRTTRLAASIGPQFNDDRVEIDFSQHARAIAAAAIEDATYLAFELDLDEVTLPLERALACVLILDELVTNVVKHAFPDAHRGTLRVSVHNVPGERIEVGVSDDGIGVPSHLDIWSTTTVGFQIVRTLAEQLGATLTVLRTAPGTQVLLELARL